jgi:hypothetical protein
MTMKRRGWTKGKPIVERLLNVFDLHFPTPAVEAMSRICACKTERNLQIFGWCLQFKQSYPWATLSYFCLQNKAGKFNATRRVVLRKCIKIAQRYLIALKCEEVPLQIEFTTFAAKKPQPLCEILERKDNWRKRNCGHRLIMLGLLKTNRIIVSINAIVDRRSA